jgi:hypothetical protein
LQPVLQRHIVLGEEVAMKYRGHVRGGLIVLDQSSSLSDGTIVEVEPIAAVPATNDRPPRGSASAVLRHAGIWSEESEEVDRALAALRQSKQDELSTQISSNNGMAPE